MEKTKSNKSAMKARGIRFRDETWESIEEEAYKLECYSSDVVRDTMDKRYKKKKR